MPLEFLEGRIQGWVQRDGHDKERLSMAIRYHMCLVCKGTGKHENKPCKMCQHRWNSKRLESIYDLTKTCKDGKEPIPMDPRGFLMFAGFDKGIGEEKANAIIGSLFGEFRVKDGKVMNEDDDAKIQIRKSPTADSRTCDVSTVTKEQLLSSTDLHIDDVKKAIQFLCDKLMKQAQEHDWDKKTGIDEFFSDFKTKFESHGWYDNHKRIQKHHLDKECEGYSEINILDVLEHIVDCCMAGLARSGSVYELEIDPELLKKAVKNTVDLLVANTEIAKSD